MKRNFSLKALALLLLLSACSKESPELVPCMCDGSESTLGMFDCMCEPMKKKPVKRFSYLQDTVKPRYQTLIIDEQQQDAYLALHQSRDKFAPIQLEYVDFRINKGREYENYDTKLGNYRFRIFGCRRENKNVFLNEGRAMQKDMKFFDVFYETMNDYYPVVVDKSNPYYLDSDRLPNPEYMLTAEISDYFMNICDEFDWDKVKQKKLRSGSSEMTVVWRVMNLAKTDVYCKGTTTGYGQISEGEPKGEALLVERAFEDALTKVPEIQCFNSALSERVRPEDIARQLAYLKSLEASRQTFVAQYDKEIKGVELLQQCTSGVMENYGTNSSVQIDSRCGGVQIVDNGSTVVQPVTDNVKLTDDYWVDVPLNTNDKALVDNRNALESSFANTFNKFCIKNQVPFENLNPQNLYKVRASIISVENANGQKGAGLIVSDTLVLTSADLMIKDNNNFKMRTINGKEMKGAAFRVNPNKNVALLLLDQPTGFTPLPLSLDLPEVNKDVLMTLGLLDLEKEGEGYVDNNGKVLGYRWSENGDAEIIVDTFVQTVTLGGALIDNHGNIVGLAHRVKKTKDSPDLFVPVETALKGLGLEICGRDFSARTLGAADFAAKESGGASGSGSVTSIKPAATVSKKPAGFKTYTPLADAIDGSKSKEPGQMKGLSRK